MKIDDILKILREELSRGCYRKNDLFPSEYDLSERFGVNKKTVNKAVALLVAEGFLARGKRGQGTKVVSEISFPQGLLVFLGQIVHPYYAKVYTGIQTVAFQKNYLLSCVSPPIADLSSALHKLENSPQVKGVFTHAYGFDIALKGKPVFFIEESVHPIQVGKHQVVCNSYDGGYEMMKNVLSRGHRNIVIYYNPALAARRLTGFHDAMRQEGIADFQERTFYGLDFSEFDARIIFKKMLQKYPEFTAIVTASDDDVLRMIKAMDWAQFPWREKKIALTGFGNVAGISDIFPIATVDQHPFRLGKCAAERMFEVIQNNEPGKVVYEEIDVELLNLQNIRRIISE